MNHSSSPLSNVHSLSLIIEDAQKREKDYDWLGAAESYKKALGSISVQDFSKIGEVHERSGHALYQAALQADSVEEFRERIRSAVASYEKSRGFYGEASGQTITARALRCHAMISYLEYWLTSEVPEKKKLLDETWRLTKESLKKFEERGDARGYGTTYNQLFTSATLLSAFQAGEKIIREGLEHGEQAIRFLSTLEHPEELARAYAITGSWLDVISHSFLPDPDEQDKYRQKAIGYWKKAEELSEETALLTLPLSVDSNIFGTGTDEALTINKKALDHCRKARNRLIIGLALESLAQHSFWKVIGIEEPDEKKGLLKEAVGYAEEAKNQYSPIIFTSPGMAILWAEAPYAEYYLELASFETDLGKKRDLLEKSRDAASDHLRRGENSGYPSTILTGHHILSKALASLAKAEASTDTKKSLLESALEHRNETIKMSEQLAAYDDFTLGVEQNYLADIRSELAHFAKDPDGKKRLLQEAILAKETCLKLFGKRVHWIQQIGSVSQLAWLGEKSFQYGNLWNSLYNVTNDSEHLRKAAEAFERAAKYFERPNLASRIAECYWRTAQAYDALSEHLKASENFLLASDNYKIAAEKIPQLKDFYCDHVSYMEAWSEIEKARHHHEGEDYSSARAFYERASNLHKATKEWRFLAPNYSAWAQLERGEDISRREQSEEAVQAFEQAARLFSETEAVLQTELGKVENPDKKQMVASLIRGANLRREYCTGRVALEEAKLLDRKGDHHSSSQRYGQAAETFEKITQAVETEQARRELKPIATLSRAWQMMARAEAEASPELYLQASSLFEEAKEQNPSEKARSLALGNSRFCRALEAGTGFADTGQASLHAIAIQHLESAAKYYLKAGFQDASEYAEATELVFDAYLHMDEAKRERDHEKKAKLYAMTEKVLQASADSFLKAKHPARRELVLRLMEKVKKERELALSLTEILHAPAFVSATAAFSSPTPTRERAVGLERFEHADIQASVIARDSSLKVGEALELEIELVNAGRSSAQLIKVEELIPEGFEVTSRPDMYRLEDGFLNLKGKQLGPLKTEELRLVLRPKAKGQYTIRPRILYLDESGKYKTHEPEPVEVTVRELGLSGWVKGR